MNRGYKKYGNLVTKTKGMKFDSFAERSRWMALERLQEEGKIFRLKAQVRFRFPISGQELRYADSNRPVVYVADFEYFNSQGQRVVEDTKGFRTRDYLLKKALMKAVHNIFVIEIK